MLSLVPRVIPDADDLSVVTFPSPDRLEMHRASGYLDSYLERALEGPPVPFRAGQTIERGGYRVTILEPGAVAGRIRSFSVELRDPEHTLVLGRGDNGLEPLSPASTR